MHPRLGARVYTGVEMKKMRVDWGRHRTCGRVAPNDAVMSGRPDRHAATRTSALIEEGGEAVALTPSALPVGKRGILGEQRVAVRLEVREFGACGENIRRERGNIAERPGQQRRHDLLRDTGRTVLAAPETISRDQGGRAVRPGLERKAGAIQMIAVGIEVEDDLDKLRRNDWAEPSRAERLRIPIDEALVDPRDIADAELRLDELEETPRAVERLTDAGRRKPWPMAG